MARKRSSISSARSFLYGVARFLGDVQAASRGPQALAKRMAQRAAGKAVGRLFGKLFR